MAELDPAIFFHAADARVEPAHDVLQNRHGRALTRPSSFKRQMRGSSPRMTHLTYFRLTTFLL
jgi:hypothetical protein